MRGEGSNMMPGQAMREALARKHDWESHGPGHWGYGVAIDLLALERRVAALERTNHDAAPAARVQSGSTRKDNAGTLHRMGTGNQTAPPCVETDRASSRKCVPPAAATQRVGSDEGWPPDAGAPTRDHAAGGRGHNTQEPVAFAVMSGGRSYDIYDTRGEAEAICRWLCKEESGDIWRVVPLVPCDATQPSHATHGECSVPPEGTQQPAITAAELDALYQGTAVLLWEGHTREEGSAASRNLLQIAATLKGLRERLEGRRE